MAKPIGTYDGSNDADGRKEVHYGSRIDTELHFGSQNLQKPQIF
jgi:hypothetical protein